MAVVKTADVLIIGSGPAAIASAWPMVEAGLDVLMLEARSDLQAVTPPRDRPSRAELRRIPLRDRGAQAWSLLLGDDLRVLKLHDHSLPKLRFLLGDDGVSRFIADSQIVANNFSAIGVFARGGLSNVWGAGASAFDQDELSDLPFPASELEPSFRAVAQRIGISGSLTDDLADYHGSDIPVQPPLELSPLMRTLLGRYENERQHLSFRLGRSRLAVLSVDHGGRRKCKLDGMCAYGCGEKSIYNSADELPDLESRSNFTCHDNARVTRIESRADGYKITTAGPDASSGPTYRASRVVVAAGVLNTTRLVLRLLEHFDADVPLLDIPTISFGLILPGRLGSGLAHPGLCAIAARLQVCCGVRSAAVRVRFAVCWRPLPGVGSDPPHTVLISRGQNHCSEHYARAPVRDHVVSEHVRPESRATRAARRHSRPSTGCKRRVRSGLRRRESSHIEVIQEAASEARCIFAARRCRTLCPWRRGTHWRHASDGILDNRRW